MLTERQEALRRAEVQLTALAETYRTGADERALVDVIEVVHGPQAVAQRFLQLQRGARTEALAFVKASVAVVSPEENVDEDRALERGVTYRLVIEAGAFDRAGYFDEVRQLVEAGGACRVRESVPIRLLVVDRELALLPLAGTDDRGSGALLVHPSGLLDALVAPSSSRGTATGLHPHRRLDRRLERPRCLAARRGGQTAADAAVPRPHGPGHRRSARDVPAHGAAARASAHGASRRVLTLPAGSRRSRSSVAGGA